MLLQLKYISLFLFMCIKICSSFEPISSAVGFLGMAAGTYFGFQNKIKQMVCNSDLYECCGDSHIPVNINGIIIIRYKSLFILLFC